MELQKPGNSPGAKPEVIERQRVVNEQAVQRVHNWIVQNEMRDVLDQMTAGYIKDSRCANCREIKSLTEVCVRCTEDERGHSERDEKAQVPQWKPRGSA